LSNNCSAITGRFRLDETHQYVRGWICNRNCPDRSPWVEILVGDQVVASIEASLPRGDLWHLETGYILYGFEFLFPDWPHDLNETESITIRHRETGTVLRGNMARLRKRSISYQTLVACELDDLRHYEVCSETRTTAIESNDWSGDPAYKAQLLGLHLERDNRRAHMQQTADGQWQYQKTVRNFRFPNAMVIMPFGIVIVDGHVVGPSLMLLNESLVNPVFSPRQSTLPPDIAAPQNPSPFGFVTHRQFELRTVDTSVEEIDQPALLLSTPGYQEYFHWHADVLPLISCLDSMAHGKSQIVLCARGESTWQQESLQLLRQRFPQHEYRLYGELKTLRVRDLLYSSGLAGRGAFLSTDLVSFYEALIAPCTNTTVPDGIGGRIYLSRRGQPRRTMSNEEQIEALVRSRGFRVIDPAQYSYQQQIALFRQANTIISPHGAGLTNLLFCASGVKVIELFGDSYINRSLQRVANLKKARYGYVVGKSTARPGTAPGRHGFSYEIPPQELDALIKRFDA
jgi:hypothetical protein